MLAKSLLAFATVVAGSSTDTQLDATKQRLIERNRQFTQFPMFITGEPLEQQRINAFCDINIEGVGQLMRDDFGRLMDQAVEEEWDAEDLEFYGNKMYHLEHGNDAELEERLMAIRGVHQHVVRDEVNAMRAKCGSPLKQPLTGEPDTDLEKVVMEKLRCIFTGIREAFGVDDQQFDRRLTEIWQEMSGDLDVAYFGAQGFIIRKKDVVDKGFGQIRDLLPVINEKLQSQMDAVRLMIRADNKQQVRSEDGRSKGVLWLLRGDYPNSGKLRLVFAFAVVFWLTIFFNLARFLSLI